MTGRDRGDEDVDRTWSGFAVSSIAYVVGVLIVLAVLIEFDAFEQRPQRARVLVFVAPLVPLLVSLAYYRWIEEITAFGVTIRVPSRRKPDPSPGRRTVIAASGLLVAAVGGFWRVTRDEDLARVFDVIVSLPSSPDGDASSDRTRTSTPTSTPPEASAGGQTAAPIPAADYGEQRYGLSEYG